MRFESKTKFVRGEIISVDLDPVPEVGSPHEGIGEKRNNPKGPGRPCIVLRTLTRWANYGMTVVVPLRTAREGKRLFPGDVDVPKAAGVEEDSVAETSQIRAVDLNKRLVAWFNVEIDPAIMTEIDAALRTTLGLA
jgi:mRNA-degrading endonuclease toxin of MazEF toxin-antitoxin module